jgi:hypothetical protein
MWSHPTLLETAMKGKNSGIKMGDQERSKPQTPRFKNSGTLLSYPHICLLGLNRIKTNKNLHDTDMFADFQLIIKGRS